ncbi:hypothetical protein [Rhodococcus sp. B50]|uniref:hypothetical protein n=1 Tax=Rhodococcus sp. B50 TaxID=2682847 RepID=UPI001BD562CB|nr:hypothetical protein [Rhodococcus sp. B50]MBS9372335.1 hypothetical protein [Rhodococcus sp. B50]
MLRVVVDVLVSMPLRVAVIILVYVTLMLPFATRMQLSSMFALGDTYLEASRVSGAGFVAANLKILLSLTCGVAVSK